MEFVLDFERTFDAPSTFSPTTKMKKKDFNFLLAA